MSRVCEQLPYQVAGYVNNVELRELDVQVVHQNEDLKLQVVRIGPATLPDLPTKSVFLVGETGSGKTTLINGCVNYLCEVQFDDNFRLRVKDFGNEGKQKSASQTDWITVYHLSYMDGMPHHYNYQLIDTPGFNDTNCLGRTTPQLQEFFSAGFGVTELNLIGVVMKATDNRRTENIHRVLKEASTCLGSVIDEIKVILATHAADGSETLVNLLADENFPYKDLIEYDNFPLSLYGRQGTEERWKALQKVYSSFFDKINSTSSISLTFTEKLNRAKRELEQQNDIFKDNTKVKTKLVKALDKTREELDQLLKEGDNIIWMRQVEREKIEKIDVPLGYHVHNCSICNRTCTSHCKDTHLEKSFDSAKAFTGVANAIQPAMFTGTSVERTTGSPIAGLIAGLTVGAVGVATGIAAGVEDKKCKFVEEGRCARDDCTHDISKHVEENFRLNVIKWMEEVIDAAEKSKYDSICAEQNKMKKMIEETNHKIQDTKNIFENAVKEIYSKSNEINELVCFIYRIDPRETLMNLCKNVEEEMLHEGMFMQDIEQYLHFGLDM